MKFFPFSTMVIGIVFVLFITGTLTNVYAISGSTAPIEITSLIEDKDSDLDTRIPLILIHGIHGNYNESIEKDTIYECRNNCNRIYWEKFLNYFYSTELVKYYKIYRFHYMSDILPIRELGEGLDINIDRKDEITNKQIVILAHSMGGLVARSYMQEHGGKDKVSNLITLATPHHGSHFANNEPRFSGLKDFKWDVYSKQDDALYWSLAAKCLNCVLNPDKPNRAGLRWDNFNFIWGSEYLNDTDERNDWLRSLNSDTSCDNKIIAYYGYIGNDQEVDHWGSMNADKFHRNLLINSDLLRKSQSTALKTIGVLLERMLRSNNKIGEDIKFLNNDGMVPMNSARYNEHEVKKRRGCKGFDHEDMKDGGVGYCTTNLTLFDSIRQDLKNIAQNRQIIIEGLSTALVLDHSGSMKGEKLEKALKASEAYFKDMHPEDMGSLSIFSTNAETKINMQKQGTIITNLGAVLAQIGATHATNIGAGLEKGFRELDKTSVGAESKAAVLLSDGQNNRGEWKSVVEKFKNKGWRIYTVGFGNDADVRTLRYIAEQTGGVYSFADTIDIINVYQKISAHIQNKSVLLSVNERLGPGGKLSYQVPVSTNAKSLNVFTNWQGSRLKTVLISPFGDIFTKRNLTGNVGRYSEGDVFQIFEITQPRTGNWKIETSWADPPTVPEQVNISVSEKTDMFANILGFRSEYGVNDPVNINVQAAEIVSDRKRMSLKNVTIKVEIKKPSPELIRMVQAQSQQFTMYKDVLHDIARNIDMFDDGVHQDYASGDGIFGNIFRETDLNGAYLVTAIIKGQKQNGEFIEKTLRASFQVGPISENPVTTSQVLNFLDQTKTTPKDPRSNLPVVQGTPYDDESMSKPMQEIEGLQEDDPLDSIDKLLKGDN